jgi:hypothetical protein
MPLIDPLQPYTFSKYFESRIDPIDLCEYFGYSLALTELSLDQDEGVIEDLQALRSRLTRISTRLISRNEQAKREMLVAPVVEFVLEAADALIRIEYAVNVSFQLQGTVDYLLSVANLRQLLVIEAKRDDLDYGFTQLMAELIALDQWERSPSVLDQPVLVGAVTTGAIWQFALLDRGKKHFRQGVNSFRAPEELELIVRFLVHALHQEEKG